MMLSIVEYRTISLRDMFCNVDFACTVRAFAPGDKNIFLAPKKMRQV